MESCKISDSMEFQSWKFCMRAAEPQITMLWIKEVEVAKSNDELVVTSRLITGQHNFLDFDMHDAMIASALKKLINTQSTFRKRVRCRRATSSKFWPILTTSTSAQLERMEQYKDSQTWSVWLCRMTMSKISMKNGVMHYSLWVQFLQTRSWKDCTSQNYRIPLNFGLWWHCMIRKLLETMEYRTINNWKLQWNFIWIRWWKIGISKPRTMLWKGV